GERERRVRRGAAGDVLDGANGLAVHGEHQQLNHRLSHRLCGGLHLSDRLPRRTRVGSRRLGGETFIRRAESITALSRRLISNALVRRSWVPPHRRGGGPPPLSDCAPHPKNSKVLPPSLPIVVVPPRGRRCG